MLIYGVNGSSLQEEIAELVEKQHCSSPNGVQILSLGVDQIHLHVNQDPMMLWKRSKRLLKRLDTSIRQLSGGSAI